MDRGAGDSFEWRNLDESAMLLGHTISGAEQGLRGCRSQAHDHAGLDQVNLRLEPGAARFDFRGVWLFMNSALAAFFEPKMLYRVGDVDALPVNTRLDESPVEQSSRGSNKREAGAIFLVAGLLSKENRPIPDTVCRSAKA